MGRPPVKKPAVVTTIRLDPAVKAALEKAAKADERTVTSLMHKIFVDWLRERKFLK